jgi:hypothetical protein
MGMSRLAAITISRERISAVLKRQQFEKEMALFFL